jgi:hypothetical protein
MNNLRKAAKQFVFYAILLGLWQGLAALKLCETAFPVTLSGSASV